MTPDRSTRDKDVDVCPAKLGRPLALKPEDSLMAQLVPLDPEDPVHCQAEQEGHTHDTYIRIESGERLKWNDGTNR